MLDGRAVRLDCACASLMWFSIVELWAQRNTARGFAASWVNQPRWLIEQFAESVPLRRRAVVLEPGGSLSSPAIGTIRARGR